MPQSKECHRQGSDRHRSSCWPTSWTCCFTEVLCNSVTAKPGSTAIDLTLEPRPSSTSRSFMAAELANLVMWWRHGPPQPRAWLPICDRRPRCRVPTSGSRTPPSPPWGDHEHWSCGTPHWSKSELNDEPMAPYRQRYGAERCS